MKKKYYESVDLLKILLLACVIISTYTLVVSNGVPILPMLGFAPSAFFLLYGYFVLRRDAEIEDRLKRSIKRAAIAFAISAVVYFALVCGVCMITGQRVADLFTKKTIFDFFVLNIWAPSLGGNIWIVQSILYALIIFYFMNKLKLLRFDLYIMIALFVIAILLGEGAELIGFHVGSYQFISGNFLTRTMPYMLLGRILYRARFGKVFKKIKIWVWALLFLVGLMLSFIEFYGLVSINKLIYYNHMIGFILMSVSVVMIALMSKRKLIFGRYYYDIGMAAFYIYSVVAQIIYLIISRSSGEKFQSLLPYLGLFTLIATMILACVYAWLRNRKTDSSEGEEPTNETAV